MSNLIKPKTNVSKGCSSKSSSAKFCEVIKSLGYVRPREEKVEHFDYLFNDTDTSNIMDAFMRNIKLENVLSDEDIALFGKLEEEGILLTGEELEVAVVEARRIESLFTENAVTVSESLQQEEFLRKIEVKKTNIAKLEELNAMINITISGKTKRNSTKSLSSHEDVNLDVKLSSQREAVNSVLESLSNRMQSALNKHQLTDTKKNKTEFLWNLDWNEAFEAEDKLIELCRHFIEDCGPDLNTEEESDVATPVVEEIQQNFQQYSKDLERLKHTIIYECVKGTELSADAFAYKSVATKMVGISDEMRRVSTLEEKYQEVLNDEIAIKNNEIEEKLKHLQNQKLNEIRKSLALHFNNEIKNLTDMKAYAKLKASNLLSFVLEILTNQCARVFLLEQLLKVEGRRSEQFTNDLLSLVVALKTFAKEQESFNPNESALESRLSQVKIKLARHLENFEIPMSVMFSYQSIWESLAWIRDQQIDKANRQVAKTSEEKISKDISYMIDKEEVLSGIWKFFKEEHWDGNNQNLEIQEMEKVEKEMKEKLNWYAEKKKNLSSVTKDIVQKKSTIVQEMKAKISRIQKDKEKRDALIQR